MGDDAVAFGEVSDRFSFLPDQLLGVHVSEAGHIYVMLMWVFAVHLSKKFEVLNEHVTEVLKWRDTARLAHMRQLHHRLR